MHPTVGQIPPVHQSSGSRTGASAKPSSRRTLLDTPAIRGLPELPNAACANTSDPEAFFSFRPGRIEQARNICRRCPELRPCLLWALTHHEHGLWAGTTDDQRDELRTRHGRKLA